jgi:succinyl-diaminopimelate desuccinylase
MISLDQVIADTQALVRIDSQNPGPLEIQCAEWVGNRLADANLAPVRLPIDGDRANVAVQISGADPTCPRLVILAHMDTIPVGEGWTVPPMDGQISGGRIYGRGSCDMKGGLAVAINVLESLAASNGQPPGDVVLAATVDEEAPGMLGVHSLFESGFFRPDDQILAPEPTGLRLRIAQMGLRWLTLRVHGRMAHAGRAHLGIDANHVMALVVNKFKSTFEDLPYEDDILGRPRFTCGTIRGGVATNVVPPSSEANFDIRIVPPMTISGVEEMLRNVVESVIADFPGASYDVELLGAGRPPVRASDDSPIVRALREAFLKEVGEELPSGGPDGHEAYTDASMVAALSGSDSCAVFGPGTTDRAHTADEFVPIADLEHASQVLWSLATDCHPGLI